MIPLMGPIQDLRSKMMLRSVRQMAFGLASTMLCAMFMANAASAQISGTDDPVQVTADDRVEYRRDEGVLVYNTNVRAVQGDTEIKSDQLTIVCAQDEGRGPNGRETCSRIQQIIAVGNVLYATPDEKIRGDRGEYDYRTDTITITGEVILSRGADGVASGSKVVYEVGKGRATITSDGNEPVFSFFQPVESQEN